MTSKQVDTLCRLVKKDVASIEKVYRGCSFWLTVNHFGDRDEMPMATMESLLTKGLIAYISTTRDRTQVYTVTNAGRQMAARYGVKG